MPGDKDYWVDCGKGMQSFRDALEDHCGWDHAQIDEEIAKMRVEGGEVQEWYFTIDSSEGNDNVNAPAHIYVNFHDVNGVFHALYIYEGELKNNLVE